jgi:hypothetical protein
MVREYTTKSAEQSIMTIRNLRPLHHACLSCYGQIRQYVFYMLYVFFWIIPRHLNFTCQHFRTLCLFHLHRRVGKWNR